MRRFGTFLAVVSLILLGWHYYLWARLVRDTALPAPWDSLATLALIVLAAGIVGGFSIRRAWPRRISGPVLWVVYTWMGLGFFLLVLLAGADLARLLLDGAAHAGIFGVAAPGPHEGARLAAVAVISLALVITAFSLRAASASGVRVNRVEVELAKLPPELDGYRIAQISDLHVGPTIGRGYVETVVAKLNALRPDLVAMTGDLVDGTVAELGAHAEPLGRLAPRDGTFFITGNHEYYSGVDDWLAWYAARGIRVLRNERVPIGSADAAGFDLAGVDDWSGRGYGRGHGSNLERALEGRDPQRALVLLAHQPRLIREAAERGVDLQLSGHTHGGQLFPFTLLVKLFEPYIAGLYALGGSQLHVSRGTGYWGPPMRLGAPAEITLLELRSGTKHAAA